MDSEPGPRRRIVIQPVTTQRSRGPKMGRMGFLLLALLLLVGIILTLCGPPPQPRTLSSEERAQETGSRANPGQALSRPRHAPAHIEHGGLSMRPSFVPLRS